MLVMAVSYLVRCRDVLTKQEVWLRDRTDQPVIFDDRLAADLSALISNQKAAEWQYAYVVEVDLSVESIA